MVWMINDFRHFWKIFCDGHLQTKMTKPGKLILSNKYSSASTVSSMLVKVSQCEAAMEQALLIHTMNMEQTDRYTQLLSEIGNPASILS